MGSVCGYDTRLRLQDLHSAEQESSYTVSAGHNICGFVKMKW